jgi:hypothetical protein
VPQDHGRYAEAPHNGRQAAEHEQDDDRRRDRHEVVTIEPAQLGVSLEVADLIPSRLVVRVHQEPARVRPPEPLDAGVWIRVLVGVAMVNAVLRHPPQDAHLCGRGRHDRQQALERAAGLERAMCEVAMDPGGQREHADRVQGDGEREPRP